MKRHEEVIREYAAREFWEDCVFCEDVAGACGKCAITCILGVSCVGTPYTKGEVDNDLPVDTDAPFSIKSYRERQTKGQQHYQYELAVTATCFMAAMLGVDL